MLVCIAGARTVPATLSVKKGFQSFLHHSQSRVSTSITIKLQLYWTCNFPRIIHNFSSGQWGIKWNFFWFSAFLLFKLVMYNRAQITSRFQVLSNRSQKKKYGHYSACQLNLLYCTIRNQKMPYVKPSVFFFLPPPVRISFSCIQNTTSTLFPALWNAKSLLSYLNSKAMCMGALPSVPWCL